MKSSIPSCIFPFEMLVNFSRTVITEIIFHDKRFGDCAKIYLNMQIDYYYL